MKKLITLTLIILSLGAAAQKKDTTMKVVYDISGHFAIPKDTLLAPNNATPLLTYADIQYLHDSVLQNMPYKFAPAADQIFGWLNQQIQLRAREFVDKQKKAK